MASDRDKLKLISNTRNGVLPEVPEARVVEDAAETGAAELPALEGLDFRRLDFSWNPNGTVSKILVEQDAGSFTLSFAWNSDGTVSRITRQG